MREEPQAVSDAEIRQAMQRVRDGLVPLHVAIHSLNALSAYRRFVRDFEREYLRDGRDERE